MRFWLKSLADVLPSGLDAGALVKLGFLRQLKGLEGLTLEAKYEY